MVTVAQAVRRGQSTGSSVDRAWFRTLSSEHTCSFGLIFYLVVSGVWLTNHRPSLPWRCWLVHLTRKIVSEMNVSSGTLNSTVPYPFNFLLHSLLYLLVSWAFLDWSLTWLTSCSYSVLWHCSLGHLTRKIALEVINNLSYGMLNCTMPNPTIPYYNQWCSPRGTLRPIFMALALISGAMVLALAMRAYDNFGITFKCKIYNKINNSYNNKLIIIYV